VLACQRIEIDILRLLATATYTDQRWLLKMGASIILDFCVVLLEMIMRGLIFHCKVRL
jgi:hypothetical protein